MKKISALFIFILILASLSKAQTYSEINSEDLNGNAISLANLVEKGPVMISFWATWCTPCKDEMKKMNDIYEKYKAQGFTFLAINQDDQKSVSKVKSYISAKNYNFPVILDTDKKIFEAYSGESMPYSLLINKNKEIINKHNGYLPGDEVKVEEEIKALLNFK